MKKTLFVLLMLLHIQTVFSQNSLLVVKIINTKNEALSQVNVLIKPLNINVKTDNDGYFKINVNAQKSIKIQCTHIGYETFLDEITLKNAVKTEKLIVMKEIEQTIPEAIITAYRQLDGVGQMPEIQNDLIYVGKKNEVLIIDSLTANTALNITRQILGKIPGFNVSETEGSGFPSNGISFRGLNPVQSVEMNTRQNGYNIAADLYGYPETYYSPAMEAVERVEVVRGASSLQYGPQFGGMINYVIKQAPENKKIEAYAQQTYGSNKLSNSYYSVGGSVYKFSYFMYLQTRNSDGWRQNSKLNQYSSFLNFSYRFSQKLKLRFEYSLLRNKIQMAGGLSDKQFDQNSQASFRARNWLTSPWNIVNLGLDYQLSENTLLTLKTALMKSSRDLVWKNEDGGPEELDIIDPNTLNYVNREVEHESFKSVCSEARLLKSYFVGQHKNYLGMGLRYYTGNMHRQGGGLGTTGSDMDFTLLNKSYEYDLTFGTINLAPYIENVFNVTNKLSITPGYRFEFLNSTAKGYKTLGDDSKAYIDKSKNRYLHLLGVGIQNKFSENTNLYLNLTQAFRPIDYSSLTPFGVNSKIDPNLKDSKGFNFDLGFRGHIKNYLNFDLGVFVLSYKNRIGLISQKDAEGNIYTLRTNVANSLHKGIESYIDFGLSKFLFPQSQFGFLSIFNSFALINAKYINGEFKGNYVEYAPKIINRMGINYNYKFISCSLQHSFTAKSYGDAANTIKSEDAVIGLIPSYKLLDFSAQIKLQKFNFKFGMNNINKVKYFTKRTDEYPGPGIIPSIGRNFYLSFGVKI